MSSSHDAPDDERASQLADEARPFLSVQGFSNERIAELARAFVARPTGGDDDFTAWALAEGRFGSDSGVDV